MGTDTAIIQVTHMLVVLSQLLRVSIDCLILQYLICVKPRWLAIKFKKKCSGKSLMQYCKGKNMVHMMMYFNNNLFNSTKNEKD